LAQLFSKASAVALDDGNVEALKEIELAIKRELKTLRQ